MDKKCKLAVIGLGQRGAAFAEMIKSAPGAELSAVCDSSFERATCFLNELGIENTPLYSSVDELLEKGDFEAAVITLPDFLHCDCAVKCCNAGKHIMLEKPMAPTAAECRKIIQAAQKNNTFIQLGFVLRHHPVFRKAIEIVKSGELGQVLNILSAEHIGVMHGASYMRRWHRKMANSGGFILAKCSHDIDIISALADAPATRVSSFGSLDFFTTDKLKHTHCSLCSDEACRFRFKGEMVCMSDSEKANPTERNFDLCVYNDDKDVVDHQVAIIDFANGIKANFSLNLFAAVPKRTLLVCGTEAFLSADTATGIITVTSSIGKETQSIECKAENNSGHGGSDQTFLYDFIDCVLTHRNPNVDYRAGLSSTVIGNAIEKSRLSGKVVEIPPEAYLY
ncbi:MAG: Gfo/Idh/MocA family oxidoreductase [Lentisphaeria bacterium]|nr:Gfo/Idh/MocA family oxidoreductase [Lentisphaeria bacterium]